MITATAKSPTRSTQARSTEAQLKAKMLEALSGDAKAHAALLRNVSPILRAFFSRRLQDDWAEVEDLVQETLIAVHTRRHSFDRERAFTPWLFSIARHKLFDQFRKSRRHQPIDGLDDILVAEGFEQSSNAAMDVNRLLASLSEKQARAIYETKILGRSVAEAAERARISVSDVKVSVHRGLKALTNRVATGGC